MNSLKIAGMIFIIVLTGCRQNMTDDSRLKPFEKDKFFKDGSSARMLPEGTVPRGYLKSSAPFFTGKKDGKYVAFNPLPLSKELLERGQERFNIYCSVCHGKTGEGNGIVVQRGFPPPASFHIERLRKSPDGYFFDVMTNGKGTTMAPERDVLDERDRWAITAYIRALQRSQHVHLKDVSKKIQDQLNQLSPQEQGRPVYE